MALLHRKLNISKDPEGSNIFEGVQLLPGVQMLISIETHISCDLPGGLGPPTLPLDPHMIPLNKISQYIFLLILACYLALGIILSTGYVAHLHIDIEIERRV